VEAASRGLLKSAHDCSDGGLAVCLAECCIMEEGHLLGATVSPPRPASSARRGGQSTVHSPQIRTDALLFGESAGRIVISCARHHLELVEHLARRHGVPALLIGKVGGARLTITPWIEESVDVLSEAWRTGLASGITN